VPAREVMELLDLIDAHAAAADCWPGVSGEPPQAPAREEPRTVVQALGRVPVSLKDALVPRSDSGSCRSYVRCGATPTCRDGCRQCGPQGGGAKKCQQR